MEQANTWKMFFVPILLAFCLQLTLPAQTTVRGRVVDGSTFEPVAFANVIFRGTVTGTKTSFDGSFVLSGNTASDSITVSFIGYESRTLAIRTGTDQHVEVILQPALYSLQEVTVKPGENPALKLLRYFREHRRDHGSDRFSSYQFDNYSRTTVYIRSSGREKKRETEGLYAGEFGEFGISAGEENIPAIPVYITESFSTSYFAGSPERKYTRIRAVNSRGLAFDNTELVSQLINRQEKIDMSENNVLIAGKSFVSPVSFTGSLYYKYYLTDTVIIDNRHTCFEISVVPRRVEDPVFSGKLWIHDTTFALRRVSLEVTGKADINFISRIRIQQDFEPVEGVWFPVNTRFLVDAANIFAANFSGKTNFSVNQEYDPGFFSSELKIDDDATITDPGFWEKVRISSFDRTDSLAAERLDVLRNDSKMRTSAKVVEASIRGYFNLGKFDAGPWVMLYNYNDVEGSRIRIGGRTNQSFSRRLFIEGYLAAGSRDKSLKGSILSEVFISRERWMRLGAMYRDDVERIGSIDEFYSGSSFLTFASSFGGSDKMSRSQVARTWLETDLLKGVSGKIFLTRKTFIPVSPEFIFAWYTNNEKTSWSSRFETSELGVSLRYQPKAVYVVDGIRRFPVDFNKYPVFSFAWIRGMDGVLGSDFSYDRLSAEISGDLGIGGLGRIDYDFIHTRVSEPLPYPLLINPAGNESVFLSGRTYNLMNYGEFVADRAYEMFASWHMDGLVLNKIPLVKKLDLRTVLSTHCIAGSFNDSRNGFYDPETNPSGILPRSVNGVPLTAFQPMSLNRPYAELAYGVENIFRFIRLDLIHRLTWLSNPGAQRLTVKISGVFRF